MDLKLISVTISSRFTGSMLILCSLISLEGSFVIYTWSIGRNVYLSSFCIEASPQVDFLFISAEFLALL